MLLGRYKVEIYLIGDLEYNRKTKVKIQKAKGNSTTQKLKVRKTFEFLLAFLSFEF